MPFSFELSTIIKDPIYGYVELTDLERRVIETSIFQRLRFITQNGLSFYTYPALRGTRFEHSIGACHLAGRVMVAVIEHSDDDILRKFLSGLCGDLQSILSAKTYAELMTHCAVDVEDLAELRKFELKELANFVIQLVRLLALLHDIGHLPFSHLGEDALEPFVKDLLGKEDFAEFESMQCKLHEYFGYKIIMNSAGDLGRAFTDSESMFYIEALQGIYRKKKSFGSDSVLGKLYELVDSDIDVDRGDYLRRDGYNSGIGFGRYDIDRLIDTIKMDSVDGLHGQRLLIAPTDASISPVEDFLLERYKLYKWLYYHHSIKYFNACLVKALESVIRLQSKLPALHDEKFKLEYFHYSRYLYKDGFICNEIWLWDVFYKAFIDLKAIGSASPEVKQAIVYLDVIINRAKLGFSIWKTQPEYLAFNKKLKDHLCRIRKSSSAGSQYYKMLYIDMDLKQIPEEQFLNTILKGLKRSTREIKHDFEEKFYKAGIGLPYSKVKELYKTNLRDEDMVGIVFFSINKFEPFKESQSLSSPDNVVSQFEFLIRKPKEGKNVIRLTDVSRLIKSLSEVWKSDIQSYLYFVVASVDYSKLASKENRSSLQGIIQDLFCEEISKWFEDRKLLSVVS